jgi:hypothetical protein
MAGAFGRQCANTAKRLSENLAVEEEMALKAYSWVLAAPLCREAKSVRKRSRLASLESLVPAAADLSSCSIRFAQVLFLVAANAGGWATAAHGQKRRRVFFTLAISELAVVLLG